MATGAEPQAFTVRAEVATRESFEPYGELLIPVGESTPHVYGDTLAPYRAGRLWSDAEIEWIVTTHHVREWRVLYLERHHNITQTFIPLGGDPIVVVVASPDTALFNGLPAPGDLKAFIVEGDGCRQPAHGHLARGAVSHGRGSDHPAHQSRWRYHGLE